MVTICLYLCISYLIGFGILDEEINVKNHPFTFIPFFIFAFSPISVPMYIGKKLVKT